MKILFYQGMLSPDGAVKSTLKTAGDLSYNGFDVYIATGSILNGLQDEVPEEITIKQFKKRTRWQLFSLIRYIKEIKPDILVSFTPASSLLLLLAYKMSLCKGELVCIERTSPSMETLHHKSYINKTHNYFRKIVYPRATKIVAISNGVKSELINLLNLSPEKINVIYNPSLTKNKIRKSYEEINHRWFTSNEFPVVVGVGRLVKQKDFSSLIKAFHILRKKKACKLIIIGDGEEKNTLLNLIQELDLENEIDLLGFKENPHPYMRLADLFVMSSAWEGFGNVLVEAMAYGTPVISTDCFSGPAEILENGKIAPLVKVGDIHAMASVMMNALDSPPDKASLIERASFFSEECSAEQYATFFKAFSA